MPDLTQFPITVPFKINAGIVLSSLVNATLGAYAAFVFLTRVDRHARFSVGKVALVLLAACSLSFGTWTSQLLGSRISLHPPAALDADGSWFVHLNSGFVVLSLLVPLVVICVAFLVSASTLAPPAWLAVIGGTCVGLSIGFMHSSLYLSLPGLRAQPSLPQSLGAFLLVIAGSVYAWVCVVVVHPRWSLCVGARILIPLVFGCGVVGANFLALSGTRFLVGGLEEVQREETHRRQRNMVTLVIPLIVTAILTCLIASLTIVDYTKPRLRRPAPTSQLSIVSLSFSADGRVLVKEDGTLPSKDVDLTGLGKEMRRELQVDRSSFHWLYALSFDWSLLAPYLSALTERIELPKTPSSLFASFSQACRPCNNASVPPRSILKLRLLDAAASLASDLDIPIGELGHLFDRTLATGTHMNVSEFLLLSEHRSEVHDIEKALHQHLPSPSRSDANTGLMLFYVRALPQTLTKPGDDWVHKYAARGFRLSYLHRIRDELAEGTNASLEAVDRILLGSRDCAESGPKSVVNPGTTYVSLFAVRERMSGVDEVLVYDFAKHQIPSYALDIPSFTPEMRAWIHNAAGITAAELLQLCRRGGFARRRSAYVSCPLSVRQSTGTFGDAQSPAHVPSDHPFSVQPQVTRQTSSQAHAHARVSSQPSIAEFEDALAAALESLIVSLTFVRDLPNTARLSPQVLNVSTAGGAPAHLIVLHAELPDENALQSSSTGRSSDSHSHSLHAGGATPDLSAMFSSAMCASFAYVPKSLFDVAHALVYATTDEHSRRVEHELARLFAPPGASDGENGAEFGDDAAPVREFGRCRNGVALVSSFSLDTLSDAGSLRNAPLRTKCSLQSLRSWASSTLTAMRPANGRRKRRSTQSYSSSYVSSGLPSPRVAVGPGFGAPAAPTAGPGAWSPRSTMPSLPDDETSTHTLRRHGGDTCSPTVSISIPPPAAGARSPLRYPYLQLRLPPRSRISCGPLSAHESSRPSLESSVTLHPAEAGSPVGTSKMSDWSRIDAQSSGSNVL